MINTTNITKFMEWWLLSEKLSDDNQRIFDKYYHSYKRNFGKYIAKRYGNQVKEIEDTLSSSKGKPRILEVGCGCGTESLWFATKGASVLGIDLDEARLSVARERLCILRDNVKFEIDADFKFANIFDLNVGSNTIDIIWMEHAFHHIEPREKLPTICFDILKPGGYIIISEANGWNPLIQLFLFRQRGFKTIRRFTDNHGIEHVYGNERITMPGILARLFKNNGFEVVSKRYFGLLPNLPGLEGLAWLEKLVPPWFAIAFTHYNIVLQKK
ncbi:MAG: class I SAM-dependent methyltransferase [Sphaerospermopsis kisseleviana]